MSVRFSEDAIRIANERADLDAMKACAATAHGLTPGYAKDFTDYYVYLMGAELTDSGIAHHGQMTEVILAYLKAPAVVRRKPHATRWAQLMTPKTGLSPEQRVYEMLHLLRF